MEPVLHGQRQSMTSNNVGHPSSQSYLANNQVYNTNSGTPMNHHRGGYGYERHQALLNPPPYAAGSGSPLTHQLPLPMIHANSRNVYAGNALTGAHGYPQNYASSLAANSMHQSMLSALQHSPPNPLQASLTPSSASSNLDLISAQHQLNAHQLSHAMSNSPVDMSNSLFSAPNYGSISQRSQASAYQNMLYPSSANNVPSNSIPAAGSSITVSSASSNTNSASSSSGAVGAGGTSFSLDRCKYPLSLTAASNQQLSLVSSTGTARFAKIGFGTRLKSNYIFKVLQAARLEDCERACVESRDFMCRSFNYRAFFPAENCELSHYDSRQLRLDSGQFFEQHTQFDYYERDSSSVGPTNGAGAGGMLALASSPTATVNMADCVEVSQSCSPDGMEFTLRTPEKFFGRIYTYGFYDSCFFDGNGGNVNVLKISRANGFPR